MTLDYDYINRVYEKYKANRKKFVDDNEKHYLNPEKDYNEWYLTMIGDLQKIYDQLKDKESIFSEHKMIIEYFDEGIKDKEIFSFGYALKYILDLQKKDEYKEAITTIEKEKQNLIEIKKFM